MNNLKTVIFVLVLVFNCSLFAHAEQKDEQSTTAGSILGSVAGTVIGYQFGGGRGKYATTAAGAVAGYLIGGKIHQNINEKNAESTYEPEYMYQGNNIRPVYVVEDDYLIKQQLSDQRKRRNMIRNGERDPMELPYDVSDVQTSWDDPNN